MKTALKLIIWITGLLFLVTGDALAQESGMSVVTLPQGGYAAFRVKVADLGLANSLNSKRLNAALPFQPQLIVEPEGVIHRLLVREQDGVVFGYDLVVVRVPSTKQFKVVARPLAAEFAATLRGRNAKIPTLLALTHEELINDGDTLALDLLVNEQLAAKFIDYVSVSAEREGVSPRNTQPIPRDFTLANVQLAVKDFFLFIDGQSVRALTVRRDCSGTLIWFSLPDGGRFVFSLVPHPGHDFKKIGVIADNRISFTWNDTLYEWISSEPIVGAGGKWNLWVLHDANYVDPFAGPTPREKKREGVAGRVLRDPIEVIVRSRRPDMKALQPKSTWRVTGPIRIKIGGAASMEELAGN
jgi:hypothetical protein